MLLDKKKILLLSLIFLAFLVSFTVYAQADLVGRYVKIEGPFCWEYLGVARTDQSYQLMEAVLARQDQDLFQVLLKNYDIVVVEKNMPAMVLDVKIFEGKAKVVILRGLQRGATGWVPLSWVGDSCQRARLWH